MAEGSGNQARRRAGMTRRSWLMGALALPAGLATRANGPGRDADSTADERAKIRAGAAKAGLSPIRWSETVHYLGVGDAPDAFRDRALEICESLATTYQKSFRDKGFDVEIPKCRLTVVALRDLASYKAFLGEEPGEAVGGHYDLDTNRLVIFDFRPGGRELAIRSERVNTFTLVHEAAHQLTFNTGLLNRRGDVPVCLSEGLAMYCELWRPTGRALLGQVNLPRLQVLARPEGADWLPLAELLTDDALLENQATRQLAYAEGWALAHYLLKTPARLPRFRAYLAAIRERRDASRRLKDAEAHLGNLDRLDHELRRHAMRLIRGGP